MRKQLYAWLLGISALLLIANLITAAPRLEVTQEELKKAAYQIFLNETGGKIENLVVWNAGEEFPSLGIGHFIWFGYGVSAPFSESFPGLIEAYLTHGYALEQLPLIMQQHRHAPWASREDFLAAKVAEDEPLWQLITFLYEHQAVQVQYIMQRLEQSLLPMMLHSRRPAHVYRQFYRVARSPNGFYALIDYVNFKGEGTNLNERYHGLGWGLLQVLENMPTRYHLCDALVDFNDAAKKILIRRIELSPPDRNEQRWQEGWFKRVDSYLPIKIFKQQ